MQGQYELEMIQAMVKIGDVALGDFPLLLAPMEDVSDHFRFDKPLITPYNFISFLNQIEAPHDATMQGQYEHLFGDVALVLLLAWKM